MLLRRLARPLIAAALVADGARALRHPREEVAHLPKGDETIASLAEKVPSSFVDPDLVVRAVGAAKIGAATLFGLGVVPRVAAGILAVLHLPTLIGAHPFWKYRGQPRRDEIGALLRDGAILGGLLLAASDTAGKPSLAWRYDAARERRAEASTTKTSK